MNNFAYLGLPHRHGRAAHATSAEIKHSHTTAWLGFFSAVRHVEVVYAECPYSHASHTIEARTPIAARPRKREKSRQGDAIIPQL
jgi:hypothetical protein